MLRRIYCCALLLLAVPVASAKEPEAATWKAGVARVKITPEHLMWLSGYGHRDKPAEGKLHDLWAKALVLEDPAGRRCVLVTMDLVGIPRDLSTAVCAALKKKHGLDRAAIVLSVSHTHTGPVVGSNLSAMYFLDDEQQKLVADYAKSLQAKLITVVGEALGKTAPARIEWGTGHATFAVNRRNNKEPDVPKLRERGLLKGPVDHDVPVLAVRDLDGHLRVIVCGYACHSTVLRFYKWSGDYPGFAQIALEKSHPEAVALFWAGCGGDQNPLPRRSVALAEEYGRQLADSVEAVLKAPMHPLRGELAATYNEIALPFADLPSRDRVLKDADAKDRYVASRAKLLLKQIDTHGSLSGTYPYPVQAWRLGDDLTFVALGGEVVVDYSLRLKKELGQGKTWVAGYTNDVMAYIPSLRVLKEGGYEGGGAMVYYGLPAVWGPRVEELIVGAVHKEVKELRDKETLFKATPLTPEKSFTAGIEGPCCDAKGNIYAVNYAKQQTIGKVTPDGKGEVWVTLPGKSTGNGIVFDKKGLMYVADYVGHNVLQIDPATKKVTVFAHNDRMNQPNDLAIAPDDTLYASDPNWEKSTGQIWRIDRHGKTTLVAEDMGTTNGIDVSPDGKILYVNESVQRVIWAFDIAADGSLSKKRLVKKFNDFGFDGMRCDVDGNLYVTRYGKGTVVVLSPTGEVLREIDVLGKSPSNLCFGGPDGRTVYVTEVTKQRLVQFRADKPGAAWKRWQKK
jgi:sugar lactone lactonase YvrE